MPGVPGRVLLVDRAGCTRPPSEGEPFTTSERRKTAPETGLISKAGERIRTADIHVGNVTLYH